MATSAVDEIVAYNARRDPLLVGLKYRRMARDPFAFFRGTDHRFASLWPRLAPPDVGPSLLICGDLHLENFGGYRADDGTFLFDINDFDEALVGPCTLDLVRCAASILLAAQLWRYTPVQAMRTMLRFLDLYRSTVTESERTGQIGSMALGSDHGVIGGLLRRSARARQERFIEDATRRAGDGRRKIVKGGKGRFRRLDRERRSQLRDAVQQVGLHSEAGSGTYRYLDAAFRVAGTGSLGLERYAVLVEERQAPHVRRLVDVKEVGTPALLGCSAEAVSPPGVSSEAERAVFAQRTLQSKPTAGLAVLPVGARLYRMRELIPEESRTGLDRLRSRPRSLRRAVAIAGELTAWAHLRGSRVGGVDRSAELARWSAGPGLDSVISSANRFADETLRDYKPFLKAQESGSLDRARSQ